MIETPLRILLVEDEETDVLLIKRQIAKIVEHPEIRVVKDLKAFESELLTFIPDLVISDYNLPTCNGMEVLQLTQNIDEETPFIFLTGTLEDEEMAANTILAGASAFILKKHMNDLDVKLQPLLKKVVHNMRTNEVLRERIRTNKIAVNKIYHYLDNLNSDNEEQKENIKKIRQNIDKFKFDDAK